MVSDKSNSALRFDSKDWGYVKNRHDHDNYVADCLFFGHDGQPKPMDPVSGPNCNDNLENKNAINTSIRIKELPTERKHLKKQNMQKVGTK